MPESLMPESQIPKAKRWPMVLLGVAIGVAGTAVVVGLISRSSQSAEASEEVVELATAEVTTHDLIEEVEWAGMLGYGEDIVVSGSGGTVTSTLEVGVIVERGDQPLSIDGKAVTVFYGNVPPYRTLNEGAVGLDVLQLETNLVALGFDPDGTVTVDDTFTYNTGLMVQRWQETLGVEDNASVAASDLMVLPGPSAIRTAPDLGSSATGQLTVVAPQIQVVDVVLDVAGTRTQMTAAGSAIEDDDILGYVDDIPIVAAVGRPAEIDDGQIEVEVPEGFAMGATFGVDAWSPESRPFLTATKSQLSVIVPVDISDADEFSVGQTVSVRQADESELPAIVESIGTVITSDQNGSTVDVTIRVNLSADASSDTTALIEGAVVVVAGGEMILDAMVVPTRALTALLEGGFAVRKVTDEGTALVGVELGSFDDGLVEVTEVTVGELVVGDRLVVPQ